MPLLAVLKPFLIAYDEAVVGNTSCPTRELIAIAALVGPHADVPIVCDLSPVIEYMEFFHLPSSWE
ncbi:hypothetical protein D3C78_1727310 [compost metagenome]